LQLVLVAIVDVAGAHCVYDILDERAELARCRVHDRCCWEWSVFLLIRLALADEVYPRCVGYSPGRPSEVVEVAVGRVYNGLCVLFDNVASPYLYPQRSDP